MLSVKNVLSIQYCYNYFKAEINSVVPGAAFLCSLPTSCFSLQRIQGVGQEQQRQGFLSSSFQVLLGTVKIFVSSNYLKKCF